MMKRIRQIFKALLVSLAVAMFMLAPMGCGNGDEKKLPDKMPTDTEHPTDHPTDHPE